MPLYYTHYPMHRMQQTPPPGTVRRFSAGDVLTVELSLPEARTGSAWLRTNLGRAAVRRRELIESTTAHRAPLAHDWHDIPLTAVSPTLYRVHMPLAEVGVFAAKTFFVPQDGSDQFWPPGNDLILKVGPAHTVGANSVYTAFPRQFGANCTLEQTPTPPESLAALDAAGYSAIPPSGTFRDLISRLDTIHDQLRFRILQLLPIHPVPTTYARMGRYGSPFASRDFLAVDPALAEFDRATTPLDQFRELLDAVHARGARLFLDLPANHTGWASVLHNHHPAWFRKRDNGEFRSPGAWGTIWEDLVELDYDREGLREFMAGVFEYWCREGVDGFRCDAGYMIPADVWTYIVARVRTAFPETVFLLEGLGGKISVTRHLLQHSNLDWAYSEIFQTGDRAAFEHYLPQARTLSTEVGPLIHYAETHDNLRLAARSQSHARSRTQIAALLSDQAAFGITNGLEWFATERVNVHGASALRWNGTPNLCDEIRRLNTLLEIHPAFGANTEMRLIQQREGNSLAVLRQATSDKGRSLLVLANLDPDQPQPVFWPMTEFRPSEQTPDLLSGKPPSFASIDGLARIELAAGEVLCLTQALQDLTLLEAALRSPTKPVPETVRQQQLQAMALRIRQVLQPDQPLASAAEVCDLAARLATDPAALIAELAGPENYPPLTVWRWPQDRRRVAPVPPGNLLLIESPHPLRARIDHADGTAIEQCVSVSLVTGGHIALFTPLVAPVDQACHYTLRTQVYEPQGVQRSTVGLLALPTDTNLAVPLTFDGVAVRSRQLLALLANGRGAMSHVPARWAELRSRYDALLAANPDPRVPTDRQILFSRCRVWLRYRGYSQYVDSASLEKFAVAPGRGEARWEFRVPVGLGRWVLLGLRLQLLPGQNRAELTFTRHSPCPDAAGALADNETVEIILRPDIESRSFHDTTKAFTGPEKDWPAALRPLAKGLIFAPHDRPGLQLQSDAASYVHQPEWHYMVERPLERERGLEPASDLFSPGYFSGTLAGGASLCLQAAMLEAGAAAAELPPPDTNLQPIPESLPLNQVLPPALQDFVVARDALQTVIAGYPWFLDWGRDTFIVLRGMIAAGMTAPSLQILREFGRFERAGTLPNMIRGNDDSNRDTSDAPLWYCVAAADLAERLGMDRVLEADCGGRTLREVLESLLQGYLHGTSNGIRVDEASGLVFSPAHYTWMDTNHPTGTPREGYPVEIQALWIASLNLMRRIDPAGRWADLAQQARSSLDRLFWREEEGFLSDCLHASAGQPAAAAIADDHLRCNQLLAITLGAFDDRIRARRILQACETLLVPGAIRTLADQPVAVPLPVHHHGRSLNDPLHPYWGRYEGDEDTRRKPAYHSGTAWVWPFPSYAEALVQVHGPSARPAARALLASCSELFNDGAVGHLPEIIDGDAPHTQRGCYAQAWSVSEILRVAALL